MQTHITAVNLTELSLIEQAVDTFLEQFYAYAREHRGITLSDFSGEVGWLVRKLDLSPSRRERCLYFDFSFDRIIPVGGGVNLGEMKGIGEECLLKVITAKLYSHLRVIFNGQLYQVGCDENRIEVHLGK